MKTYNGHKNWNHWNVALWLNNDETLHTWLRYSIRFNSTRDLAARDMLAKLKAHGLKQTPDGAPYTKTSIRAAMVGL